MKTKHYLLGALAAMMLMTSCQDDTALMGNEGETAMVSFELTTPEIATRADYSDGTTATVLQYAVYDENGEILDDLTVTNGEIKLKTQVNLKLTTGNTYTVIFWAAAPNAPYTVDFDNKLMSVNYDAAVSNDENRDAFYKHHTFTVSGTQSETVELRRPFAQLNIGTNDYEASKSAGYTPTQSSVTVSKIYKSLNLATDEVDSLTTVKYQLANIDRTQKFPVTGYEYIAMNYLLMDKDQELIDVEFTYTDGTDAKTRTVGSVPVQRNHRTNIYGQLLTSNVDINVEIKPEYEDPDYTITSVNSAKALADALTAADENIEITLSEDIDVPITMLGQQTGGSGEYKLGGDNTKNITINLNGHRLNITTTYWSAIGAKNADALFTIKNGRMTSTGNSAGTWNAWDLRFSNCNYVFENVDFEKAVALDNVAKSTTMKDVTITDTHNADTYGLWITAEGQTVSLEDCVIDMTPATDGRGIKIDEQYVDDATKAKVTLNVKNVTFKTEEKAAIVVKSAAGADINLTNVNIENVAADQVNAVWVDADAAASFDLVNVTGGSKILEGAITIEGKDVTYETIAEALAAAADGDVIVIPGGEFVIPTNMTTATAGTITFRGYGKGSVMMFNQTPGGADGGLNSYADGMTLIFDNLKVVSPNTGSAYTGGFGRVKEVTFNDCVYVGQFRNMGAVKFNNCTIDPQTSYIYTDYGNADFVNCTFNASKGKAIQVYNDGNTTNTTINISNCAFTAAEVGHTWDGKPVTAIDINSNGEKFTVNITGTTATGFGTGLFSGNGLWNIKGGEQYVTINIDGKLAYPYYTYDDATKTYSISSVEGMQWFANQVNVSKNTFSGYTIKLTDDINLDGIDWEPVGQTGVCGFLGVFDGNGKTISNLNVDSEAEVGANYSSGLFGWIEALGWGTNGVIKNVTVDGATIKGHHNCAVIAGYLIGAVENCHVKNATISCTLANADANGDKAGSIAGILAESNAYIKNCSAENVTISAGRDAGQIVGAALNGWDSHVTGCTATNVTVTANGTSTGANIRNEIVGRK